MRPDGPRNDGGGRRLVLLFVFPMPMASAGGSMPRPYGGVSAKSRRGDPCGRPERRGRRSLRFLFWSTPPQPVGAIHESPAAAKRRFFRCHRHRRAGQCPAPTVCPNRVGATLAVARNAGDGVPYGFYFDLRRRNAAVFPMPSASGGTARGPFPTMLQAQKSPGSEEPGNFSLKLCFPIRRAETSDQSRGPNGVIRPPAYQNELSAATRRKNPPVPRNRGIFIVLLRTASAVRPHVFYSRNDTQDLRQLVSGDSPHYRKLAKCLMVRTI